jgi:hypothetical protein
VTVTVQSLQGQIPNYLAGLLQKKPKPADASAINKLKTDYQNQITQYQTNINTANNELSSYAKPGAYTTPGNPANPKAEAVTIPAILMQPAKGTATLPTWYEPIDGLDNLGFYWASIFYNNKYQNNWDYPTTNLQDYTKNVYLYWAYQFYTDPKTINNLNKMVQNAGVLNHPDQVKVAQAVNKIKSDAKAVINHYLSQKAQVALNNKNTDAATTKYINDLNTILYGAPATPSPTANVNTTTTTTTTTLDTKGTDNFPPNFVLPSEIEFNLPPHKASLPLSLQQIDKTSSDEFKKEDGLRRGRFYFYADTQATFTQTATKSSDVVGQKASQGNNGVKYGFQFLWNPETWSSAVAINPDVTPGSSDYWQTSLPVFPSGQQLNLQILLDRTNDFFSLASVQQSIKNVLVNTNNNKLNALSDVVESRPGRATLNALNSFLNNQLSDGAVQSTSEALALSLKDLYHGNLGNQWQQKIYDLSTRGTLADIEYLYKTINGANWTRLGQRTSDIGFLMMTLVEIEIGPSRYLGYLNSLNINHTFFTTDMIPLRSTLDLSFVLMASAKVAQPAPGIGGTANTSGTK